MSEPTLGMLNLSGWLKTNPDPANSNNITVVDSLFAHYIVSDASQSILYPGQVSSYAKDIQQGAFDIEDIITRLESSLNTYFLKYYDDVSVEVTEATEGSSRVELNLFLEINGSSASPITLRRIIEIHNGVAQTPIRINNQ